MVFKEGIKLTCNWSKEKIFINTGVQLAGTNYNNGSIRYTENAYIPKHDWRSLSIKETKILKHDGSKIENFRCILLRKLPGDVIKLIKNLKLSNCEDYPSVLNAFVENSKSVEKLQNKINEILFKYAKVYSQTAFHRIVFNPPQMETLTYYITDAKLNFIGLHIDRSTIFDFNTVENSANRICINISAEQRVVYFINLTLNQILMMLKNVVSVDISKVDINNIGEYFFNYFPNYPVIKVIQDPYEYYIMPTDNVLHDGSSLCKVNHDICLVYLGDLNTFF